MSSKWRVRFYLVRADPCEKCSGSGTIVHPLLPVWQQWRRGRDDFFTAHHVLPSDVENGAECPNCRGTGEIRSESTLKAALDELGDEKAKI